MMLHVLPHCRWIDAQHTTDEQRSTSNGHLIWFYHGETSSDRNLFVYSIDRHYGTTGVQSVPINCP